MHVQIQRRWLATVVLVALTTLVPPSPASAGLIPDEIPDSIGYRGSICVHPDFPYHRVRDGEIYLDEGNRDLWINGSDEGDSYTRLVRDTKSTDDPLDDELVVTMEIYKDGPDEVKTLTMPYFNASTGGEIDSYTRAAEPQSLYLTRIIYRGPLDDHRQAFSNGTRIRTYAYAWWDTVNDHDGYDGGEGRDCVKGSYNNGNRISTNGGSDYVETFEGDDVVRLGDGPDTALTKGGDDYLNGGTGGDRLEGGKGFDCYRADDGFTDGLDDAGGGARYVPDPGMVGPFPVETIDIIANTDGTPTFTADCL